MKFIKKWSPIIITLVLLVFLTVEISFFIANIAKIKQRWMFLIFEVGIISVMYIWHRARKIKNRYVEFVRLESYLPLIQELSNDTSIAKYATHLVFLTSADNPKEIEHKIIYSILNRKPKRADIYWFVHVDTQDEPYTNEYKVTTIIPNEIIRLEFKLGFRVSPRINLMFRKVVEDMVASKEINVVSRYESLQRNNMVGDFQFIVMEKFLSPDNELGFFEKLILRIYFWLKDRSLSEERGFGLDASNVTVEQFPLIVTPISKLGLKRVRDDE
jgi:KUP system potassium uptake protein